MTNFIEELYYGNIDPQVRSFKQNATVNKQMEILSQSEDFLCEVLKGKDKKNFLDFSNAWSIVNSESNLDSFITGFRLGAKLTYDTFCNDQSPFQNFHKE